MCVCVCSWRQALTKLLDWNQVHTREDKHGHVDGVVTDVGQKKVRALELRAQKKSRIRARSRGATCTHVSARVTAVVVMLCVLSSCALYALCGARR